MYQRSLLPDQVPSKRTLPWKDILEEYARELGNCPEMSLTEWYKELAGMVYSRKPEAYDMMEAVVKMGSPSFGVGILRKFITLPSFPAPDTIPRALRGLRETLVDTGVFSVASDNGEDTFSSMLQKAEETSGEYYSGLEARFGQKLKQRFRLYHWEENKLVTVGDSIVKPDFICEKLALSIEVDGWEFHQDRPSFSRDRQKSRLMQRAGYYHLQFSGGELAIYDGMNTALGEIETFIRDRKLA